MNTKIIDGKKIAEQIKEKIKEEIADLKITPGLAVILIGADPASHLYVSLKEKACHEVGIHIETYLHFATTPQEKIINQIEKLNQKKDIHGILVQLPLPDHFDTDKIIKTIDPKKDVDGFHPANIKNFLEDKPTITPPVILGILKLLESTNIELKNKKITILANSEILTKPLEKILKGNQIRMAILPDDPTPLTRDADIVITALGRPKFLTNKMIKDGVVIIDVGTTRLEDGTSVGDVDFESVKELAGWLTPVPGGVGPMTVALLLQNVLETAKKI